MSNKKILLIAGHGEGDPGAVSKWGREADMTRELAGLVYERMVKQKVSITLYDTVKDCYQQTRKGSGPDYGAYDFVLEIHFNAKVNKDPDGDGRFTGTGGYIHDGEAPALADKILTRIVEKGFKKWNLCTTGELCNCNYAWNAGTRYFLLETAFLDDGDDMKFYMSNKEAVADAIVRGTLEGMQISFTDTGASDTVKDPQKPVYFVQCGAFAKESNAAALLNQLKNAGFDAVIKKGI